MAAATPNLGAMLNAELPVWVGAEPELLWDVVVTVVDDDDDDDVVVGAGAADYEKIRVRTRGKRGEQD